MTRFNFFVLSFQVSDKRDSRTEKTDHLALRSEEQAGKSANAGPDPLLLVSLALVVDDVCPVGRHLNPHDEVGAVARGAEDTSATEDLVHWAAVDPLGRVFSILLRHEMNDRHLCIELFGKGVI